VTAECFTDFLQDTPSKSRGEIQVEFLERFVFIEVFPRLMWGVSNPIEMGWLPVVFEDVSSDTPSECFQSFKLVSIFVWQANRE
jgi:hypothetical protein